jgi:hypothetical protein
MSGEARQSQIVAELNQNLARAEREHITNIIKKITYAHHIRIDIPHEWIIYDKFNLKE